MMQNPCAVCGGTEVNLIDGFYYCTECGTQDTQAQETMVEQTFFDDGTAAKTHKRKIKKVLDDAIKMSDEWQKWHACNFLVLGLTEELIKLGAATSVQEKVLWIWARYMKEFIEKDKMGTFDEVERKQGRGNKSIFEVDEEKDVIGDKTAKSIEEDDIESIKLNRLRKKINTISIPLIISILYLALNFDRSEIQLSNLLWFIREGRLNFAQYKKYVPKELRSSINLRPFLIIRITRHRIQDKAMTLIKVLHLTTPVVPDLRKMVQNYVAELCLPKDFQNLVCSLMHAVSCDYLHITNKSVKLNTKIPDYEGIVMSYVVVALKMIFGLDDSYEYILSNVVDKINTEDYRQKSYKIGLHSQVTDRLFSFREWSYFLQLRSTILSEYYEPMARRNISSIDTNYEEEREELENPVFRLRDQITLDILNKVPLNYDDFRSAVPKSEFLPTFTPTATYTEVISHYIQDLGLKLLISEDFTQYSLKYACVDLELLHKGENIITGISEENKAINKNILGHLKQNKCDVSLVYVRNCDNKNWWKDPPISDDVIEIEENGRSSIENDVVYTDIKARENSHFSMDTDVDNVDITLEKTKPKKELESIEEEREGFAIFDDDFSDVNNVETTEDIAAETQSDHFIFDNVSDRPATSMSNYSNGTHLRELKFNPATFQRDSTIKQLVIAACKKYKIPIPMEYKSEFNPRKRKSPGTTPVPTIVDAKAVTAVLNKEKKKDKQPNRRGLARKEVYEILNAYYQTIHKDGFIELSRQMKAAIAELQKTMAEKSQSGVDPPLNEDISINNPNDDSIIEMGDEPNKDKLDQTVDSCVQEVESEERHKDDEFVSKVDLNFDGKSINIRDLYLKYWQSIDLNEILDLDDAYADDVLDKKITENRVNNRITLCAKDLKVKKELPGKESSESEDEVEFLEKAQAQERLIVKPLIENPDAIPEFKYWIRHYETYNMNKNREMAEKFNLELKDSYPKSFCVVLSKCASIIDYSNFSLYRHVWNLESILFRKMNLSRRTSIYTNYKYALFV